ncbi:MAG: Lrp/AsnC family transcriptional regulator [Sandaracinobacteroides sp.]
MDSIDRIDRKILHALQLDGRITNQALADQVALSPSACLARVRRLEQLCIITGYGARIAIEKLRAAVIIYGEVTLKRHLPEDFRAAETLFSSDARVLEAAEISGKSDYLVKVIVTDMAEWRDLTAQWTAGPWQIERVSSSVAMHRTKGFSGYPL